MFKKIKKPVIHLVTIFIILVICNYIGQNYVKVNNNKQVTENDKDELEESNIISYIENFDKVGIKGNYETSDNPWGCSIGEINYEGNKSLFLTPNTSIEITSDFAFKKIMLSAFIHPWVRSDSDGANLLIRILDSQGEIQFERNIIIGHDERYLIDLGEGSYNKGSKVEILCGNGENNNDCNDWVVIEELEISSN